MEPVRKQNQASMPHVILETDFFFFFGPFVFCCLVCFLHDLGPNEVGPTLGVIYGACCMFLFLTVL